MIEAFSWWFNQLTNNNINSMNKIMKRGFTLIELLVVIAIIGILASVVLASLNTARDKGEDAAAKSNLNNMRAQAELYYDDTDSYSGVCTRIADAVTAANGTCFDQSDAGITEGWAAQTTLNDTGSDTTADVYCVDFTGASDQSNGSKISATDALCS